MYGLSIDQSRFIRVVRNYISFRWSRFVNKFRQGNRGREARDIHAYFFYTHMEEERGNIADVTIFQLLVQQIRATWKYADACRAMETKFANRRVLRRVKRWNVIATWIFYGMAKRGRGRGLADRGSTILPWNAVRPRTIRDLGIFDASRDWKTSLKNLG